MFYFWTWFLMLCMEIFLSPLRRSLLSLFNLQPVSKNSLNFNLQRFAEGGEKTEEPTDKRRRDARSKGQVARSQELNTAFVLLMGFFILNLFWEYIYGNIADYTVYIYTHLPESTSVETIRELFIGIMLLLAKTAFPIMLAILVMGLAINIYQVGLMFSTERLEWSLKSN